MRLSSLITFSPKLHSFLTRWCREEEIREDIDLEKIYETQNQSELKLLIEKLRNFEEKKMSPEILNEAKLGLNVNLLTEKLIKLEKENYEKNLELMRINTEINLRNQELTQLNTKNKLENHKEHFLKINNFIKRKSYFFKDLKNNELKWREIIKGENGKLCLKSENNTRKVLIEGIDLPQKVLYSSYSDFSENNVQKAILITSIDFGKKPIEIYEGLFEEKNGEFKLLLEKAVKLRRVNESLENYFSMRNM